MIITGHSLGAAVAGVYAYLFRKKYPDVNLHAWLYACPPIWELNRAKAVKEYTTSIILNTDVIPRLSFGSLYDLRARVEKIVPEDVISAGFKILQAGGNPFEGDWFTKKWEDRTKKKFSEEMTNAKYNLKLFAPGNCLFLAGRDEQRPYDVTAQYVPNEKFDEIVIKYGSEMFTDHMPYQYDILISIGVQNALLRESCICAHIPLIGSREDKQGLMGLQKMRSERTTKSDHKGIQQRSPSPSPSPSPSLAPPSPVTKHRTSGSVSPARPSTPTKDRRASPARPSTPTKDRPRLIKRENISIGLQHISQVLATPSFFEMVDSDKDGKVSLAELQKIGAVVSKNWEKLNLYRHEVESFKQHFQDFVQAFLTLADKDGNGAVSLTEFGSFLQMFQTTEPQVHQSA